MNKSSLKKVTLLTTETFARETWCICIVCKQSLTRLLKVPALYILEDEEYTTYLNVMLYIFCFTKRKTKLIALILIS